MRKAKPQSPTGNREQHRQAVRMFDEGMTAKEVATALGVACGVVTKWRTAHRKLQKHNLKQRFIKDFESGKRTVEALAAEYGIGRRTLLAWKREAFGTGSQRERVMYRLHEAGMSPSAIADLYGVHVTSVHAAIRKEREKARQAPTAP